MQGLFAQVTGFCQMAEAEVLGDWHDLITPPSADLALGFAEKLILCPTTEAARSCIRRDSTGAVSFLLALEGVNRRIKKGGFQLATESPEHQTPFYLLACAVQEYIDSLHAEPA
jgi:hypothetical protein